MIRWSTERIALGIGETRRSCVRIAPAPLFLRGQLLNNHMRDKRRLVKMYDKVITMCWSIKEVNKNLQDRESMADYSIEYLKKACSDLSEMLASEKSVDLDEEMEVLNRAGNATKFTVGEVAEMLRDTKKIIEFNLIDHVDQWAKSKAKNVPA